MTLGENCREKAPWVKYWWPCGIVQTTIQEVVWARRISVIFVAIMAELSGTYQ